MVRRGRRATFGGELTVHHDPEIMYDVSKALRHTGRRIVLVPTMVRCMRAI